MSINLTLFDENFRNLLSILFDQLRINFFAIDTEGYYIARNNTLTSIVGQTERADKVEPKAWNSCLQVMHSGKHEIVEEEYQGRYFLSFKSPLIDNGKTIGVLGVAVDITDRKQAELAKTEFLENMSHDLRTPFAGIISLSEYLHNKETDPTKKALQGEVLNSGKRLLALLNQVIELSTQGSHPVQLTTIHLNEVIQEVVELLHAEVTHKGLTIQVSCPPITLTSDRMRLSRILLNLIGNAVKYTRQGAIDIQVTTNPHIIIKVIDTGIGIPEDKLSLIFERFTKLKPAYQQASYTGAGIGLHIAKAFADEIGGKLTVTSKLGQGSCFSLSLLPN